MSYVFDNSPLTALFKNYYRKTFRTLWERFDALVADGSIVSVREALREIEDGAPDNLVEWSKENSALFAVPTGPEGAFVGQIYAVEHFQQNIEVQKLVRGGRNADPFVIAKAAVEGRTVVTMERLKPNASRIPNICAYFGVRCMHLEDFMVAEGWVF